MHIINVNYYVANISLNNTMHQEQIEDLKSKIDMNQEQYAQLERLIQQQHGELRALMKAQEEDDIKTKTKHLIDIGGLQQEVYFELISETYGATSYNACYHLDTVPHGGVEFPEITYHGCDRTFKYMRELVYGGIKDVFGYHPPTQEDWLIKGPVFDAYYANVRQKIGVHPLNDEENMFVRKFIARNEKNFEAIGEMNRLANTLVKLAGTSSPFLACQTGQFTSTAAAFP